MYLKYLAAIYLLSCAALKVEGVSIAPLPYSVPTSLIATTDWDCSNDGWSCKDCKTLQYCNGVTSEFTVNCKDQNPTLPYCSPKTKKCVARNDDCQKIPNEDFICPDIGYFPNLLDCKQYNQCPEKDKPGVLFTCMYNTVYDHLAQACKTGSKCYTAIADCGSKYKIINYSIDPSFYIICRGPNKLPLLKECPDKKLYFNTNKMKCDYRCSDEGNFEYPGDKTKYFFCARIGNTWESFEMDCDDGKEYDPEYKFCLLVTDPPTPETTTTNTPETTTTTTAATTTQAPETTTTTAKAPETTTTTTTQAPETTTITTDVSETTTSATEAPEPITPK